MELVCSRIARAGSTGLIMESPVLGSLYLACFRIWVLPQPSPFPQSDLGSAGSFSAVFRLLMMKHQILLLIENRSDHGCVAMAYQYLELLSSSHACSCTQIWLQITLLRAFIILGANENVHILNTLFADEIFWTLNSSGTDGEHMPSQFVWWAQPRVLPGLGN